MRFLPVMNDSKENIKVWIKTCKEYGLYNKRHAEKLAEMDRQIMIDVFDYSESYLHEKKWWELWK